MQLERQADLHNLLIDTDPAAQIAYTDGDATENAILAIVESEPDLGPGSPGLSRHIKDWPTEYHFSPLRLNLLRPVRHLLRGRVLEVGGGCGALSPYIAEQADELIVVEGAVRRARICATRCRGLANTQVWATNFSCLPETETFDTVLVIGVLEYSPSFFKDGERDPFDAFLAKVRTHLAPGGRAIIAIENRFGLKYFCGAPEDHEMVQFYGIEDRYRPNQFKTFGRRELLDLLDRAGLGHTDLLLPFPDYKLPQVVLHQTAPDHPEIDLQALLLRAAAPTQSRSYQRLATEQFVWPNLAKNGLAADLANSFLVVAAPEPLPAGSGTDLVFYYTARNGKAFSKETIISRNDGGHLGVRRAPLYGDGDGGEDDGGGPPGIVWKLESEPFFAGRWYMGGLLELAKRPVCDVAAIAEWCRPWIGYLEENAVVSGDDRVLPGEFIDCNPLNIVQSAEGLRFFDREWELPGKPPLSHVMFRGLHWALSSIGSLTYWGDVAGSRIIDVTRSVLTTLLPDCGPNIVDGLIEREVALQRLMGQDGDAIRTLLLTQIISARVEVQASLDSLSTLVRAEHQVNQQLQDLSARVAADLAGDLPNLRVRGYIDSVRNGEAGHRIVSGWAFDPLLKRAPKYVVLLHQGKPMASAPVNVVRNDVHQSLGIPESPKELGFWIAVPNGAVPETITRQNFKVAAFSPDYIGELGWAESS
ncbi:SAM-dependent methyltransferase [Azospirillum sp. OGB3]|uniref:class I SAM-dependent methyltransferase n=1 Tax=Azospirillum sp. OGB3 TaxID=2587012 RepID=UPI0016061D9A|nr:class I SAM-dependent methyltransferase [Azospirillum sp. OGB3]MBB3268230.1 SAM-dependent methyltransferase [Azospirillum sp. OGB3]